MTRKRIVTRALQRLGIYVLIMLFRGWVLYVGLNILEARWSNLLLVATTDGDQQRSCWYKDFLKKSKTALPSCYGRVFDFSDHVVFYFVQVLSIVWTEYLDACIYMTTTTTVSSAPYHHLPRNKHNHRARRTTTHTTTTINLGFGLLSVVVAYAHLIVYAGVYKTARWFHTASEILVGFFISFVVTIALVWGVWPTLFPPPLRTPHHDA